MMEPYQIGVVVLMMGPLIAALVALFFGAPLVTEILFSLVQRAIWGGGVPPTPEWRGEDRSR